MQERFNISPSKENNKNLNNVIDTRKEISKLKILLKTENDKIIESSLQTRIQYKNIY